MDKKLPGNPGWVRVEDNEKISQGCEIRFDAETVIINASCNTTVSRLFRRQTLGADRLNPGRYIARQKGREIHFEVEESVAMVRFFRRNRKRMKQRTMVSAIV